MLTDSVTDFQTSPTKVCPECGEPLEEQADSYIMVCERCLAKQDE